MVKVGLSVNKKSPGVDARAFFIAVVIWSTIAIHSHAGHRYSKDIFFITFHRGT